MGVIKQQGVVTLQGVITHIGLATNYGLGRGEDYNESDVIPCARTISCDGYVKEND